MCCGNSGHRNSKLSEFIEHTFSLSVLQFHMLLAKQPVDFGFCPMYKCRYSQVQELSTIQPQLNNPVDNVSMEPNNAYSSSEPIYEQVANGNEQDHTVVS